MFGSSRKRTDIPEGRTADDVPALLELLRSSDGITRKPAREALEEIGGASVPGLIEALSSPAFYVRWEAAKALGELPDRRAAQALVKLLNDSEFEVRWLAAKALIPLGPTVAPLIAEQILEFPESVALRKAAHHVLSAFDRDQYIEISPEVKALLEAIEGLEPAAMVPRAAQAVVKASGRQ